MELNRDGDGFLINTGDWSEEVMHQMADADGFETATAGGSLVKLSSTTASSSASISFT